MPVSVWSFSGILVLGLTLAVIGSAPARANSAALVLDADSGEVLYSYRADAPHRPASLTKMMTLYLVFESMHQGRLHPDQKLTVSRRASNQRPSRLGLSRGRTIAVKDAVLALVTKSANDAAVVIAESIGGTEREFAQLMTRRAAALGMRQTYFANASGLHHGQQWTTARDMAILAKALIRDFPTEYRYFSTASFKWHGRRYENHNALLASYSGVDGIKTGYIRQSGFNLVASAKRDGRRIIGVVLGNPTQEVRDWRMTRLLDYGFGRRAEANGVESGLIRLPYITVAEGTLEALLDRGAGRVAGTAAENTGQRRPEDETSRADSVDSAVDAVWSIQVGAYGSAAPAELAVRKAADRIPSFAAEATPAVIPVERNGTRLFRARLVGLTEDKAREACRSLARHNIACLALAGEGADIAFRPGL